jgi:type VI secretion system protein ImpA
MPQVKTTSKKIKHDYFENLLDPISKESPCGIDLDETGELYNLEVLAKGCEETQFSEAKPPDHKEVLSLSQKLFEKSKDLWVVNYLITSVVEIDNLNGVAKGVEFLYELISSYWNVLFPAIDVEDDEPYRLRLTPIGTLFSSNSHLVKSIRNFKISNSKRFGNFSYNNIIEYTAEKNNNELDKVYNSIKKTDEKDMLKLYEQFVSTLEYCQKIEDFINVKVTEESNTSNTKVIIKLLSDIIVHLDKGMNLNVNWHESIDEESLIHTGSSNIKNNEFANDTIKNCKEIKKQLENICDWYDENEPSSPVPLMLKRTINLIGKSFDEIIKDIATAAVPQINEFFKLKDSSLNNCSFNSAENHISSETHPSLGVHESAMETHPSLGVHESAMPNNMMPGELNYNC